MLARAYDIPLSWGPIKGLVAAIMGRSTSRIQPRPVFCVSQSWDHCSGLPRIELRHQQRTFPTRTARAPAYMTSKRVSAIGGFRSGDEPFQGLPASRPLQQKCRLRAFLWCAAQVRYQDRTHHPLLPSLKLPTADALVLLSCPVPLSLDMELAWSEPCINQWCHR